MLNEQKPVYGYFANKGRAYWSGPDFPNHYPEDEQPVPQYPVVTQFKCCDFDDGNGWGQADVEKHAKVLDSFLYDVGAGDTTYVVTVEVATEADLLWLLEAHEACDEECDPL